MYTKNTCIQSRRRQNLIMLKLQNLMKNITRFQTMQKKELPDSLQQFKKEQTDVFSKEPLQQQNQKTKMKMQSMKLRNRLKIQLECKQKNFSQVIAKTKRLLTKLKKRQNLVNLFIVRTLKNIRSILKRQKFMMMGHLL